MQVGHEDEVDAVQAPTRSGTATTRRSGPMRDLVAGSVNTRIPSSSITAAECPMKSTPTDRPAIERSVRPGRDVAVRSLESERASDLVTMTRDRVIAGADDPAERPDPLPRIEQTTAGQFVDDRQSSIAASEDLAVGCDHVESRLQWRLGGGASGSRSRRRPVPTAAAASSSRRSRSQRRRCRTVAWHRPQSRSYRTVTDARPPCLPAGPTCRRSATGHRQVLRAASG